MSGDLLRSALGDLEDEAARLGEDVAEFASSALAVNAKEWMMLANLSDALTVIPRKRHHHIILSLSPVHLDLERKLADVLNVPTEARRIGEEHWPNALFQGEVFHDVLARGTFDTVD